MSVTIEGTGIEIGKPKSGGDDFNKADHEGKLLMFVEPEHREVDTEYGTAQTASCDYVVAFEDDGTAEVFNDTLIFGAALAPAVYNAGTPVVVGRLGKAATAKPGRSRAWILDDPSDDDLAIAQAFADKSLTVRNGRVGVQS